MSWWIAIFFGDENDTVKLYAAEAFKHVTTARPHEARSHLSAALETANPDFPGHGVWGTTLNAISRALLLEEQGSQDEFPSFVRQVLDDSEIELWEVGDTLGTTAAANPAFRRAISSYLTADDITTQRVVAQAMSDMAEDWRYFRPNKPPADLAPTFRTIIAGLNTDGLYTVRSLADAISDLIAFHEMRRGRRKYVPYDVIESDSDTTGNTDPQDIDDFVTRAADSLSPYLRLTPEQAHVEPPQMAQPSRGASSFDVRVGVLAALNEIARYDPRTMTTHLADLQALFIRSSSGDDTDDHDVPYMLTIAGRILIFVAQDRVARIAAQL